MSKIIGIFLAFAMLLPFAGAQATQFKGVRVHDGRNQVTVKNHKYVITVRNHKVVSVMESRAGKMYPVKRGTSIKRKGFGVYNGCWVDVFDDYYPYDYLYSYYIC